jgi:long-chain fatty acid transport protein
VGVLVTPREGTNLGLGYRSKIDFTLSGELGVTTLGGAPVVAASGPTVVAVSMPEQVYISLAQAVGSRLTLLADASHTRWSRIDQLRAVDPATGTPRDVLTFAFDDSWRFAVGGEWLVNERWTLRAGAARDESPAPDAERSVRLPDENRTWLTVGAQWRATQRLSLDAGYAHLMVSDATVNLTRPQLGAPASFTSIVRGSYESSVDIFSLQATYALR